MISYSLLLQPHPKIWSLNAMGIGFSGNALFWSDSNMEMKNKDRSQELN